MNIRSANIGEESEVVGLINDLIVELNGPPLDIENASSTVGSIVAGESEGHVLVAEDDDDLVGVCTVSFQTSIRSLGKYAIVQEMYVAPEHRGGQIGAQLIAAAKKLAKTAGCPILELSTPPDGERAEEFYLNNGFFQVGVRMRSKLD